MEAETYSSAKPSNPKMLWSAPALDPQNLPEDGIGPVTEDLEVRIEKLYDKIEGLIFQQQVTGSNTLSEVQKVWTKIEQLESQALKISYQQLEAKQPFSPSAMRAFLDEAHEFMKNES
ncbi:MAG: hypothetical protein ACPG4T_01260 [Nannocystaceae bacterium]